MFQFDDDPFEGFEERDKEVEGGGSTRGSASTVTDLTSESRSSHSKKCPCCPLTADSGSLCRSHKRAYECIVNDAFPRTRGGKKLKAKAISPEVEEEQEKKQRSFNKIFGPPGQREVTSPLQAKVIMEYEQRFPEGHSISGCKRGSVDYSRYVESESTYQKKAQIGVERPLDWESFTTMMQNRRGWPLAKCLTTWNAYKKDPIAPGDMLGNPEMPERIVFPSWMLVEDGVLTEFGKVNERRIEGGDQKATSRTADEKRALRDQMGKGFSPLTLTSEEVAKSSMELTTLGDLLSAHAPDGPSPNSSPRDSPQMVKLEATVDDTNAADPGREQKKKKKSIDTTRNLVARTYSRRVPRGPDQVPLPRASPQLETSNAHTCI